MQTVSRLIQKFVPEHYQLSLAIQREARTFHGTLTMNGQSPEAAGEITVHAKGLAIESVTLDGKEATFSHGENDELHVQYPDIHAGRHIVTFSFSGTIDDPMHGLYPCYYEHDGQKKELLATQFESHHAREVFPCIDEPEAKATFDVTLTTEQNVSVLGNMPILSQKTEGDQLVTTFETTPRMSTYLLAWVVGELHKKTATTKRGVEVNVWATPAQRPESLDFALDIARETIDFFEEYFDTPYPLPKSDHVALPDFSAGAMENWGLVTYREVALIADPETTSVSGRHYVALVIAHELSHQWFGNLVTMKWWNNLWLNESFATMMEYFAIDKMHPEWDVWLEFATTYGLSALRRDNLDGVQPVQLDVNHPDEISTLFDPSIVYGKGARLLRMCQQYMGHEAFQAGLKAYFAAYKFGNTEGDDLWNALSAASGKDIGGLMNTWISQPGYPVVSATLDGSDLTLSQQQFFVGPHQPSEKIWPVPLNASDSLLPELFEGKATSLTYDKPDALRLNVGDSAHFITHYDDTLMQRLIDELAKGGLSPLDRLQLLHEHTLLARGGIVSSAALVPLLSAYENEVSEAVWDIISLTIGELKKFVETNEAAENKLRELAGKLARPEYQRLGWDQKDGEPETDTKLRATILGMMLYSQDEDIIGEALKRYAASDVPSLPPEIRSLIMGAAVRHGDDPTVVETLLGEYRKTPSAELRDDLASALTSTRDPETVKHLLTQITDGSTVRSQDVTHWFVWLIRNRFGRELTWQWIRDNWDWVVKTFGGDKSYDDFPRYTASALVTAKQLQEYKDFFGPMQSEIALRRVITVGISEIEGRVELIERDGEAVQEALLKL